VGKRLSTGAHRKGVSEKKKKKKKKKGGGTCRGPEPTRSPFPNGETLKLSWKLGTLGGEAIAMRRRGQDTATADSFLGKSEKGKKKGGEHGGGGKDGDDPQDIKEIKNCSQGGGTN